jgi:hypothetical protein
MLYIYPSFVPERLLSQVVNIVDNYLHLSLSLDEKSLNNKLKFCAASKKIFVVSRFTTLNMR